VPFPLARILHLASVVICLIVIASFALFAINQTNSASAHQQQVLNGEANGRSATGAAGASGTANGTAGTSAAHKGSVRAAIDDASNALTSPFSGVTSSSSSEWTTHIVRLALALALYGFGLGFVARVIRVRV
jgi:hypothetical protein